MPTAFRTMISPVSSSMPLSGSVLWLDGSDSSTLFTDAGVTNVTTNGQSIYQWNDKSGNSRHATQTTSGNRPTWLSPANGLNGLGAVTFNGSTQRMTMSLPSLASGYTLYLVAKTSTSQVVYFSSPGAGVLNTAFLYYFDGTQIGITQWGAGVLNNAPTNTFLGSIAKYDGTHSTGNYLVRTSNQSTNTTGTMTQNSGTPASGTGAIGSDTQSTPGNYLNQPICELVLFDSQRSTSDDTAMKNYFASKWGITWS